MLHVSLEGSCTCNMQYCSTAVAAAVHVHVGAVALAVGGKLTDLMTFASMLPEINDEL